MSVQRSDSLCSSYLFSNFELDRTRSFDQRYASIRRSKQLIERKQTLHQVVVQQGLQVESRLNKSFHHVRYMIIFIGGLSVGFMSLLRLNITVAILNMVNQTQIYLEDNKGGDLVEYFGEGYEEVGEFDWDNEIQQLVISYYMIAYTVSIAIELNRMLTSR